MLSFKSNVFALIKGSQSGGLHVDFLANVRGRVVKPEDCKIHEGFSSRQ